MTGAQAPKRAPVPLEDLVARLTTTSETCGFSLRARLETTPAESGRGAVLQVRALGRQDDATVRVLYQVLWPSGQKGRAIFIEAQRRGTVTGFVFDPPDRVMPLEDTDREAAVFDTALRVADLIDDFHRWPDPVDAGMGTTAGQPCRIIDFRRSRSAGSGLGPSRVTACVSEAKALPMLVEKYRPGDRLATRVTVEKTIKRDRWAPARFLVEDVERGRSTRVDVTRAEIDLVVSLAEFSLLKIRDFGRGAAKGPEP